MSIDFSQQKVCTKCGESKLLSYFHKRTLSKDGLMSQCKDCVNTRIRANYKANPEDKIAKTRQYHLDHPEWSKETLRNWHVKNRDERNARVKARLATDVEFREYRRKLVARKEHERRAQKAGTKFIKISQDIYDSILLEYNNCCWICELPVDKVFWDHVKPLAKGGAHIVDNLRPACGPCNSRKNALWPFTEDMKNNIAEEVRALRISQSSACSVTDGSEV